MTDKEHEQEIGHLNFSLAGARDRAEAAEADNAGLRATLRDEILARESAEARAAAKSELIDNIIATWEPMAARLIEAEDECEASRIALKKMKTENETLRRQLESVDKFIDLLGQVLMEHTGHEMQTDQKSR